MFADSSVGTASDQCLAYLGWAASLSQTDVEIRTLETDGSSQLLTFRPDGTFTQNGDEGESFCIPRAATARAEPERRRQAPNVDPSESAELAGSLDFFTSPETTPEPAAGEWSRGKGLALIVGGSIVGLVALVVVAVGTFGGDESAVPTSKATPSTPTASATLPTVAYIPASAPPGWSTEAHWSSPVASSLPPVVNSDGLVAVATPDRGVVVANPDGTELLRSATKSGEVPGSLVAVTKPFPGFAWNDGSTMHVWTRVAGETTYSIPGGADLHGAGTVPVAWSADSNEAHVPYRGSARVAIIPDGTVAMGAVADGDSALVVAAALRPKLWLSSTDGGAPRAVDLGRGTVAAWLGMSGDHVIVAWEAKRGQVDVRMHDVRTGRAVSRVTVPARVLTKSRRPWLIHSQDRARPAIGPIFLREGAAVVADNPDVSALATGEKMFALGRNGALNEVGRDGSMSGLDDDTAIPLGIGAQGEAIVRVNETVYALLPSDEAATTSPEPTPPPSDTDEPERSPDESETQDKGPQAAGARFERNAA